MCYLTCYTVLIVHNLSSSEQSRNTQRHIRTGRFLMYPYLLSTCTSRRRLTCLQGFSRVKTLPAGRVRKVSKCCGSSRVRRCSKCRGSGRIGSTISKLAGRVGSRGFSNLVGRVGSDHDPRDTDHSRVGSTVTRELFRLTRGSDPRIWPAGPSFSKLTAACRRTALVTRGSGPRVRNYIVQYLPLLA